jgi:hypothetical protein
MAAETVTYSYEGRQPHRRQRRLAQCDAAAVRRRAMPIARPVLALAGALLAAAPAAAQTLGGSVSSFVSPPAEQLAVAPGGVDMHTGRYAYNQTDLSIGEASESGGLALARTMSPGVVGHEDPFAPFSHNWDIMLTERRVDIATGNYQQGAGQDFRISVRFGGRSETFEAPSTSSAFTQTSRTSQATLTFTGTRTAASVVYTFQATDGTLATFRPLGNGDCASEGRCAYVSQIVQPDGTRFSFEYENPSPGVANMTRLRSVASSRGYALLLEYGGTGGGWNQVSKACVINLAVAVKPADNVCPAAPAATSSYAYGTGPLLASATDPAGAVWGCTRRRWAGSCRPIRSATTINSTFIPMSEMIRPTGQTLPASVNSKPVLTSARRIVRITLSEIHLPPQELPLGVLLAAVLAAEEALQEEHYCARLPGPGQSDAALPARRQAPRSERQQERSPAGSLALW